MRHGSVPLMFAAALLMATAATAEEVPPVAVESAVDSSAALAATQAQVDTLEQRLAESERLRTELTNQLQGSLQERENAVMSRLRQENQRLKLQLKEAQASQQPPLLSEEQSWFAIGGAVTLVAVLFGALLRGSRKGRREWIN